MNVGKTEIPQIVTRTDTARQKNAARDSLASNPEKKCWLRFDDLGCFSVLLEAQDRDTLREYYSRQLGSLEYYDASHGGNYLETLEAYLKYNRHLAKAADALSCHRNTVNYRINKIRELLDLDFDDGDAMFQLRLALQIRSFLRIFD